MWTQPRTQEQREYFSKHAAKRRVYGLIMTLLQGLHGVLALAAWTSIIGWAISAFVSAPWLIVVLAGTALLVFHLLFRVTWSTYWYDRMDNDTATDSSIFIPLAIMALLLYSESHGARKFLEAKVKPVEETAIVKADESFTPALNTVDASETRAKQAVRDAYREKIAAVEQPYNANIAAWKRKKASTPEERQYINSNVRAFEASREAATAKYRNALSDSLLAITSRYAAQRQQLEGYVASKRTEIVQGNTSETSRYQSEMEQAGSYAWLISVVLLGLIAALGYAQVRINVKSGILPLRNYTVLDAHGSAVERIYTALADAMNRRWLQFAVWLHRWLSPKEVLTSFDGTVVTRPGEYNTPEGFFQAPKPPHRKTTAEAEGEVLAKLARNPGVKLNADQFAKEVEKSIQSNGHYRDMPLPGGKSEPTAQQNAQSTVGADQAQLREILTEGLRLSALVADDATAHKALYVSSPLLDALAKYNLVWGADQDGVFCAGIYQSGQYYPVESLLKLRYITFPPQDTEESNGYILFKQTGDLFKQIRNTEGKVIGLEYKGPRMEHPTTLSYSQVVSRISSYRNNTGRRDETRTKMLEVWTAALELFELPKGELVTVNENEEVEP